MSTPAPAIPASLCRDEHSVGRARNLADSASLERGIDDFAAAYAIRTSGLLARYANPRGRALLFRLEDRHGRH